jgi:hypothetical protein
LLARPSGDMNKLLSLFLVAAMCPAAESSGLKYRLDKGEAPPADAPVSLRSAVSPEAIKVLNVANETSLEFWFVAKPFSIVDKAEEGATLSRVQHGALVGLVRVGKNVNDRRGDRIPAGLYVMRLSFHPVDGAHQGIAPQRDFLVLTKPESDSDASANPSFGELMQLAKQGTGTSHPLSFSCWNQDQEFSPGLHAAGESDTVLHVMVGTMRFAIIVAGRYEG